MNRRNLALGILPAALATCYNASQPVRSTTAYVCPGDGWCYDFNADLTSVTITGVGVRAEIWWRGVFACDDGDRKTSGEVNGKAKVLLSCGDTQGVASTEWRK